MIAVIVHYIKFADFMAQSDIRIGLPRSEGRKSAFANFRNTVLPQVRAKKKN